MIFWIIQWSIVSLTFIFLLHHLYSFFIDTLTIPKVKDLVNKPQDRYNELFTTLERNNKTSQKTNNINNNNYINNTNVVPNIVPNVVSDNTDNMHNELLDFLNNIKRNNKPTELTDTNYSLY
jgi:hypothetical protein